MAAYATGEADVLNSLLPSYEAEGFQVFVQPSDAILPPFMKGYRPDAIALKGDRKIAIEIKRSESSASASVRKLNELFSQHPDWELRVYYVSSYSADKVIEVASLSAIERAIKQVRELQAARRDLPALVLAWSTLEAVARALLPDVLARPQTPNRLIEALASEGYLTPSEADTLRHAGSLRNVAAHGQLDMSVDQRMLNELIGVLGTLADILAKTPKTAA
ncbi:MAG: hypothetical protein IT563_06290 [Alphaproteobacteria bacterium]|nr:hypothetical protein [Alphaproteobacteria bacterium]